MTTPGGVPNLPAGALTLETLASKLQDMSAPAMRGRVAERMPSIFDLSTGGNVLSDLSPFGIITSVWSAFNSLVANADPNDIQGPDDLPGLLVGFIDGMASQFIVSIKNMLRALVDFLRGIPVLSGLIAPFLDALDDLIDDVPETLLEFLDPIGWIKRMLRFAAQFLRGIPVLSGLIAPFLDALDDLAVDDGGQMTDIVGKGLSMFGLGFLDDLMSGSVSSIWSNIINAIINPLGLLAQLVSGFIPGGQIPGLDASKIVSGLFAPSRVQDLEAILNNFGRAFTGVTGTYTGANQIYNAFLEFRARLGGGSNNLENIQRILDENSQTKQILSGVVITPINALISSIKAWYDAFF